VNRRHLDPVDEERFWTPAELAKRWHLSPKSVIRLVDADELDAMDVGHGRARRLRVADRERARFERVRAE
jgi:hypothetical protein